MTSASASAAAASGQDTDTQPGTNAASKGEALPRVTTNVENQHAKRRLQQSIVCVGPCLLLATMCRASQLAAASACSSSDSESERLLKLAPCMLAGFTKGRWWQSVSTWQAVGCGRLQEDLMSLEHWEDTSIYKRRPHHTVRLMGTPYVAAGARSQGSCRRLASCC